MVLRTTPCRPRAARGGCNGSRGGGGESDAHTAKAQRWAKQEVEMWWGGKMVKERLTAEKM